jgi:succinate dehydrogenase / fumarate reductase membrane anchor subunit
VSAYTKSPVGAGYGIGDWLLQRLTAVVMAGYTVAMGAALLACRPSGYADWKALFDGGIVRLGTLIFLVALLYHAWVGVRDIVMDYVKHAGIKLAAMTLVAIVLIAQLAWSAAILWGR